MIPRRCPRRCPRNSKGFVGKDMVRAKAETVCPQYHVPRVPVTLGSFALGDSLLSTWRERERERWRERKKETSKAVEVC
jgi:hypothetical protein